MTAWMRCIHLLVAHDCIFPNRLERPEMLCKCSSPLTAAIDGGLILLLGLMVKYSCLEVLGFCLSTTKHQVCDPLELVV